MYDYSMSKLSDVFAEDIVTSKSRFESLFLSFSVPSNSNF